MFFSVVIPSHDRKKLLQLTLESLQRQNFKDFEVIVVATEGDPAFEHQSRDWGYPIQFTYVPNDPSKGRSASVKRNHGVKVATSKWIAFTDDDCIANPDWLSEAHQTITSQSIDFLEGGVEIPKPDLPTFTYKGMKRLGNQGGYQTCNMFYKRQDFLELGGFDKSFPYYLEDTDLAWTFLDSNRKAGYAANAIVTHPVPPAQPRKMLESAWRMEQLPLLYKKHRQLFKKSNFRVLPRPFVIFLVIDVAWLGLGLLKPEAASLLILLRLALTTAVLLRMFKGCHYTWPEFVATFSFLLICPWISLYSLIKGNLRQGVWIFLR